MTQPELSAVIVTWNSEAALDAVIGSLRRAADDGNVALELVVVDNGSGDMSVQRANALGVDVIVANSVNAGYGVATAQGLARAAAPWALLLNPDVTVAPSFLRALADAAESVPADVATLVPELRYASDGTRVNSRGIQVDEAGVPAEIDVGATDAAAGRREVFGGSSGGCLLRLDAVRSVGGIEPAYFAYLEDVDLAWRLQRAGYRAIFIPGAVAYHEGSASLGADSPLKAFLVARNRRVLFRLAGPYGVRARSWRTVADLGHAGVVSLSGSGRAPWLGRLDAIRLRRYTRFVRRSTALLPTVREPVVAPRASLVESLRRKRAAHSSMVLKRPRSGHR
jgi:GT2 family glycosyltransferase